MALVRILSDDAHYREKLIKDLQARGFEVEIAMHTEGGDADSQISISECTFEDLPKLAATLQQESETSGPVSTDAVAFLVPQLLSGNIRSLKAFVVRSKLQAESAAETESALPDFKESQENAALVAPTSSIAPQTLSPQSKDVPAMPKFKIPGWKKKGGKEEESELVPHGLIWQAISEASAVSAQQQAAEIAAPVENFSSTELPQENFPELSGKQSLETKPTEITSEGFSELVPSLQVQSVNSVIHSIATGSKRAKSRLLTPFTVRNSRRAKDSPSRNLQDRRFWNVAALSAGVAVLAMLAFPHVHRLTPLPSNVEAHIAQPAEPVPLPAASKREPSKAENISRHSAIAIPVVKQAANPHEDKSGLLAKDTVVRYGAKSAEPHDDAIKPPEHTPGVRHFSDLD